MRKLCALIVSSFLLTSSLSLTAQDGVAACAQIPDEKIRMECFTAFSNASSSAANSSSGRSTDTPAPAFEYYRLRVHFRLPSIPLEKNQKYRLNIQSLDMEQPEWLQLVEGWETSISSIHPVSKDVWREELRKYNGMIFDQELPAGRYKLRLYGHFTEDAEYTIDLRRSSTVRFHAKRHLGNLTKTDRRKIEISH